MSLEKSAPAKHHIASLDGVRGVAVLLVPLHHHGWLKSGWLGVDLFFVLSGYLITGILRSSRSEVAYWQPFWIKRVTRIFPPLVAVLCVSRLLGFISPWWHSAIYLLSFGDVLAYIRPGSKVLMPLWSLGVEEHFYLLWPFAVRLLRRKTLVAMMVLLLVVEPVLRGVVSLNSHDWQLIYYLTPFRLDGLAVGSLLALLMESPRGREVLARCSGWGLLLVCALWIGLRIVLGHRFTRDDSTWMYNAGCYWLVALAAGLAIAYLLTQPRSVYSRWLSSRGIVFVGQISYGIYLYQVLIEEVVQRGLAITDRQAIWIDVPITIMVGWLSFQYLERPLIAWGRRRAAGYVQPGG